MDLLLFLVVGGSVLAVAPFALLQARRMRASMTVTLADNRCVACDSADVTSIGPGAYRCRKCGYEGGSGMKSMYEQAKVSVVASMAPEERQLRALENLREAQTLLLAVDGTLKNVLSMSRRDMAGLGGDGGQHKQQEMTSALSEMLRAQQCVKDAALKLGAADIGPADLEIDFTSAAFALDVSFDNVFSDMAVHRRIQEMERYTGDMRRAITEALGKVSRTGTV